MKKYSPDLIRTTTQNLQNFEPGFLPKEMFYELSRICVLCAVDIAVLRKRKSENQILLTRRPDNDPYWPSMYHIPGTILRYDDAKLGRDHAFKRLITDEYTGLEFRTKPKFVNYYLNIDKRGAVLALLFKTELKKPENQKIGKWFDLTDLPKNLLKSQYEEINLLEQHLAKSS